MVIDGRYSNIGPLLRIKEVDTFMVKRKEREGKSKRLVDEVIISNREAINFRISDLEEALDLLRKVKSDIMKSDITKVHGKGFL
ncbi:MAG: hypothetical protein ACPLSJ_02545 [Thermosulfidibacteraceae bacterium]|jgi:hypothetical protein